MSKQFVPMAAVLYLGFLVSACQNPVVTDLAQTNQPRSLTSEASRYANNYASLYRTASRVGYSTARSTAAGAGVVEGNNTVSDIVRYFVEYPMEDDHGRWIHLADIPPESVDRFLDSWVESTASDLVENVDPSVVEPAIEALSTVSDDIENSGVAESRNLNELEARELTLARLASARQPAEIAVTTRAMSRGSSGEPGGFLLDNTAMDKLLRYYTKGYVISGFNSITTAYRDTTFGNGHDALFTEDQSQAWANDTKSVIGVAALASGVTEDTVSRWVNKKDWIRSVYIGRPRFKYWAWTQYVLGVPYAGEYRYKYPSSGERAEAAKNAKKYIGKDYDDAIWAPGRDLNSTSSFWCSKLVWRAWYDVAPDRWDLNWGHWGSTLFPKHIVFYTPDRYVTTDTYTIDDY